MQMIARLEVNLLVSTSAVALNGVDKSLVVVARNKGLDLKLCVIPRKAMLSKTKLNVLF